MESDGSHQPEIKVSGHCFTREETGGGGEAYLAPQSLLEERQPIRQHYAERRTALTNAVAAIKQLAG